jgi:hypothetical protein
VLDFGGGLEKDVVRESAGAETGRPCMGGRARSETLGERSAFADGPAVNWGSDWFRWVAAGSTLCRGEEGPELVRAWSVLLRLLGET